MPFEHTGQDGELTLLSYLFLQVSGAWPRGFLRRSLSKKGGRGNDFSCICLYSVGATSPSHGQEDPAKAHSSLCFLKATYPLPAVFSSTGFPPIPGLEPIVGTDGDVVAATLAAAQKLASSEDTAPAEENEDEDEVWLRAWDFQGLVGGNPR